MKNNEINIIDNDISFKKIKNISVSINDLDKYINFVNFYNNFINHRPKLFKPIKGKFVF